MREPVRRLAAAAGIEPGYWDGLGNRRDLSESTALALIGALGLDPAGDLDAQARHLEDAAYAEPLPCAVTVDADAPPAVELGLPLAAADRPLDWEIELEDGSRRAGRATPVRLEDADVRQIGAAPHGRFRLPLDAGGPLPPGYHTLRLDGLGARCALIAAPARCHIPPDLDGGARRWGVAAQLYALRSARNWGIGDFTDLAVLARTAAAAGADFIGLPPLHARHLARPAEASPYAPSSRLMLDPMYLDVEAIADFAVCAAARQMVGSPEFARRRDAARDADLVDHAAVAALKLPVLAALHARFAAGPTEASRQAAFRDFERAGGADLHHHALFEAWRLDAAARDGALPGWRAWPAAARDPDSALMRAFARDHAAQVAFQKYLQWQAELQLADAAAAARAAGMRIGLYRDLAVGAADDGAECWGAQDLFSAGASVGAPPDLLNREGQDWGLPPWKPAALARAGYAPLGALLRANMRAAGALRIDHVMALTRLFWIPAGRKGADGGYVRNALPAMAGVVALESRRHGCMVIGEDLGSVPDGLRDTLAARGFLSYRVLLFERHWHGDGSFKLPGEYPRQALATAATHDMATIAEYWSGADIARRDALGLFPEPRLRDDETARRGAEREALARLFARIGAPADPGDAGSIAAAMHAAIGQSEAMLAIVQLDDVTGETAPINIPGTHREYPNWRRKLGLPLERLAEDPRWRALGAAMHAAGRGRA
ncbi:MAG: 4-alpha-glucanotransferase [Burkholderiales bacterium]|nr:4-alpha-glucanotransferase [Burkholderiales bacterium]